MAKITKEKYFNIDPLTLVAGRPLTFDLLIYLPLNGRIITFKKAGMTIDDLEQLKKMKARGLSDFHVREADRPALEAYLTDGAPVAAAPVETAAPAPLEKSSDDFSADSLSIEPIAHAAPAPEVPEKTEEEIKVAIEQHNTETAAALEAKAAPVPPPAAEFVPEKPPEEVMAGLLKTAPENIKSRDDAKEMVKNILKVSGAGSAVTEIVDNPDTEHATSVSIYTTLFAMGLKKNDQNLLQDLIVASLMHDIGFTQLNPAVLNTPRLKQSAAQNAIYETHVNLGLSLLAELDYVPNKRVLTLLSQHHEKFNGTGYPQHLESFRVDENAQLISIADLIDTICRGKYDGTVRSLGETLHVIAHIERTTSFPEYFNPDIFKKVMNWLKKGGGEDYLTAAEKAVTETKQAMLKTG